MKKAKMFLIGTAVLAIAGTAFAAHHRLTGDLFTCDPGTSTCVASIYNDQNQGQQVIDPPTVYSGVAGATCSSLPSAACHVVTPTVFTNN